MLCNRNQADRPAVVAIVVVGRIDIAAVEVQVVCVTAAIGRRRPIVAVAAHVVHAGPIPVAGGRQEDNSRTRSRHPLILTNYGTSVSRKWPANLSLPKNDGKTGCL